MTQAMSSIKNAETANRSTVADYAKQTLSISDCLARMTEHENYWKRQSNRIYEKKLNVTDPEFIRINHIRQTLRFYLVPALKEALDLSEEDQSRFAKWRSFLFSENGIVLFFEHFHRIVKTDDGHWKFIDDDPFDRDTVILFDLYKVKRQIEGIKYLKQLIRETNCHFPSYFTKPRQIQILDQFQKVLLMTFQQTVNPKYRSQLLKQIDLDFFKVDQLKRRRSEQLFYTIPDTLENSRYRRIFLHILLKKRVRTTIKKKLTEIPYDLAEYEQLVHECIDHFLKNDLYRNELNRLVNRFHVFGKPFSESVLADLDQDQLIYEGISEIKSYL